MQANFINQEDVLRAEVAEVVLAGISADDLAGELLLFKNAVLCRAETNKNGDEITSQGLQDLAFTLPLMPLDDEHRERMLIGMFTAARVENDALLTDGLVYAKRFPDIASDIMSGAKKLSIEAEIGTAICSVCGGEFRSAKAYCSHLKDPARHNAHRIIRDLKAIGGGVTYTPAGTNTTFDRNSMMFAASEQSDGMTVMKLSAALAENPQEEDMEELERLQAELQQLTERLTATEATITDKDAAIASLNSQVATLTASLESEKRVRERSITLLRAGYSDEQLTALAADLAIVSDSVIHILVASAQVSGTSDVQSEGEPAGQPEQTQASTNEQTTGQAEVEPTPHTAVLGDSNEGGNAVLQWSPKIFG